MAWTRRTVLATVLSGVIAGCSSNPNSGSSTCDPSDVSRPPAPEDEDSLARDYPSKPNDLTQGSVADFLRDFEIAYAWNRILDEHSSLGSLGVNVTTEWEPEAADDGYLASSRIETDYTQAGSSQPVQRTYIASYFVSPGPVFRVELDSESADPREHAHRQLVQCNGSTS